MKWTPFLSAVVLGAAVTTAMENARSGGGGGGADGPKPTASIHGSVGGGVIGHHSHHGHGHHSYTGAGHEHMSGTLTMEGSKPTGGVEGGAMQKRGAARGGNHQSGSGGVGEHTMPGGPPAGSHFPSGPRPSGKGHHTGAGGDGGMPSFTLSEGAQQTGGAEGGMVKRGVHGGHHSHGGGHQSMTGGQQTITSITHVHVPTTLTTMITANGH